MYLFTNRTDAKHQEMDEANNYSQFLAHADEPEDFYRKYKDDGITRIKGRRGIKNLFDDSDTEDRYWFMLAKRYLGMHRL